MRSVHNASFSFKGYFFFSLGQRKSLKLYRSSETVSFFLPFFLRAAKTLRPFAVDMR